jgi:acyl carrier protein
MELLGDCVTIRSRVLEVVQREVSGVVLPSTQLDRLGLDSLETLNLFLMLSKEVDDIPDSEIPNLQTVGDIIGYLERQ